MAKPEIQILVCLNEREEGARKPSCGHRNALAVYHQFKDQIRSQGLRDRVMVNRTGCLKHCSQGTVVAIWPHNFWLRGVNEADVAEILSTSVVGGKEVQRLEMPDIPWE